MFSQVKCEFDKSKEKKELKKARLIEKIPKREKNLTKAPLDLESNLLKVRSLQKYLNQLRISSVKQQKTLQTIKNKYPEKYKAMSCPVSSIIFKDTYLSAQNRNFLNKQGQERASLEFHKKNIYVQIGDRSIIRLINIRTKKVIVNGMKMSSQLRFFNVKIYQKNFPEIIFIANISHENSNTFKFNFSKRKLTPIFYKYRGLKLNFQNMRLKYLNHYENPKYFGVDRRVIPKNEVYRISILSRALYLAREDSFLYELFLDYYSRNKLIYFYRINDGPFQPLYKDIGFIHKSKPDKCEELGLRRLKMFKGSYRYSNEVMVFSEDYKNMAIVYEGLKSIVFIKVEPELGKMYPICKLNLKKLSRSSSPLFMGFADNQHFIILSKEFHRLDLNRNDPLDRPKKVEHKYLLKIFRVNELPNILNRD